MHGVPSATPQTGRRPQSVLVTGGAGFIGARVTAALAARGARVLAVDDFSAHERTRPPTPGVLHADVTDAATLAALLRRHGPFDRVLHLAAVVGVRRVLAEPESCLHRNVAAVAALLEALAALPPARRPRVLAASSSEVYAERDAPLAETAPLRPDCARGRWCYATSKLAGERLLDGADLWPAGEGPVHLRFFNVVGPGQSAASGMVLARFVEQAIADEPLQVHGDGSQVRSFGHVAEVARVLAELVTHPALPAGPLNVGGTARASVLELARQVAASHRRAAGRASVVTHVDPRLSVAADFVDVQRRVPCLRRLRRLVAAAPSASLEAIVDDTLRAALRAPLLRAAV